MKPTPVVHIGFPKTATTWMQKYLFNDAHGFLPIPRNYLISVLDEKDVLNRQYYEKNIHRKIGHILAACPHDRVPVATWEGFSMNMYDRDIKRYYTRTARRIAMHFPNAKILVAVREQNAMLSSLYNQALDSFLIQTDFPDYLRCNTPFFQTLSALEYDGLITHYQKIFKPENVLVWPHEEFCTSPGKTLKRIKAFTGANIGISRLDTGKKIMAKEGKYYAYYRTRHLALLFRAMDPLLSRIQRKKGISAFKMTRLADFTRSRLATFIRPGMEQQHQRWRAAVTGEIIGNYYAKSNQALGSLTGLDLSLYGYALSAHQQTPDTP